MRACVCVCVCQLYALSIKHGHVKIMMYDSSFIATRFGPTDIWFYGTKSVFLVQLIFRFMELRKKECILVQVIFGLWN